jgi:hypothetical protein
MTGFARDVCLYNTRTSVDCQQVITDVLADTGADQLDLNHDLWMAFFSSNERKRTINLGGVNLTTTHDDLLAEAQQKREQRLFQKKAQEAASTIQVYWRARLKLQEVRRHFLELFDREPVGTIASTRFLVLGGGEQARLSAWATAALQAGDNALWLPFTGPDAPSWLVLIRQIALMLLTELSRAPR